MKKKNKEISIVRSSVAEYLTFVASSGNGGVEAVYVDENVWLTQKTMAVLYDVETHTINYHLNKEFTWYVKISYTFSNCNFFNLIKNASPLN